MTTKIIGILNITRDSFYDGSKYINIQQAVEKGISLNNNGADIVELGAESSHPDSSIVSVETEIKRLEPVINALKKGNILISVDTYKPKVMSKCLKLGVDMINDISGLNNIDSISVIKEYNVPVVIMFSKNLKPHAEKAKWINNNYIEYIIAFFEERCNYLVQKGIKESNIIIDPGMGFFLGSNPEPSLSILKNISKLKILNKKIFLSTSQKSFIGTILNRDIPDRNNGTLASEIWAYIEQVSYIRTHNTKALKDAITMIDAIKQSR